MTPEEIEALIGRTVTMADRADAHRCQAYRRLFDLADDAPLLAIHWLLFTTIPRETREDGHARAMPPFPPLPWPRRMWAGGAIRWHAPIVPDEPLLRHTVVTDARLKHGTTGDFLLARVEHRIETPGGSPRVTDRQDIAFLPRVTSPATPTRRQSTLEAGWTVPRCFGPVDLFRYSALTLNGHRIHYDAEYARDIEHYPGIVVHGPLLASHLIHAAADRTPAGPTTFDYRAIAPVFSGNRVRVAGHGAGDRHDLEVIGEDHAVAMAATMTFAADPSAPD